MNTPITFELAKLLKEKGFDKECNKYYEYALVSKKDEQDGFSGSFGWKKGELNLQGGFFVNNHSKIDLTNDAWFLCAAPTISEVIMWFYEKHGIWISVAPRFYGDGSLWFVYESLIIEKNDEKSLNNNLFKGAFEMYKTPTEAYLASIEYCLTKLI